MSARSRFATAVVPTLGRSPWLRACLEALGAQEGGLEIVLVIQGPVGPEVDAAATLADRVLRRPINEGFAAANNLAIAATRGDLVATVNDDAVVEPGWLAALRDALDGSDGSIAAVQGVNLMAERPDLADGCGLAWNRRWQAVQIGHGHPAPPPDAPATEIFGVSATAALYRRDALEALGGEPFDRELFAYYEDVDLACRLRGAGLSARLVPAARARHAGSVTGRELSRSQVPFIYGNRQLVLARFLGRAFWPRLPIVWRADAVDLARSVRRRDGRTFGIVAGWLRAVWRLPLYGHLSRPVVPPREIARSRDDPSTD